MPSRFLTEPEISLINKGSDFGITENVKKDVFEKYPVLHLPERAPFGQYGYGIFKADEVLCVSNPVYNLIIPIAFSDPCVANQFAFVNGAEARYLQSYGIDESTFKGDARFSNKGIRIKLRKCDDLYNP
jgi:hypothetical protein